MDPGAYMEHRLPYRDDYEKAGITNAASNIFEENFFSLYFVFRYSSGGIFNNSLLSWGKFDSLYFRRCGFIRSLANLCCIVLEGAQPEEFLQPLQVLQSFYLR
jgi:hypothetical protein